MDRRKFLGSLIGGVAAAAAVRTFPFRVFSFPKKISPYFPEFNPARRVIAVHDLAALRTFTVQLDPAFTISGEPVFAGIALAEWRT